jgi:predicted secreted hydrolase
MREIRSYGSEGGGTDWFSLPLSTGFSLVLFRGSQSCLDPRQVASVR